MTDVLIRTGNRDTSTQKGDQGRTPKEETHPEAKLERRLRRNQLHWHLDVRLLASRVLKKDISVVWSHPVFGILLRDPYQTNRVQITLSLGRDHWNGNILDTGEQGLILFLLFYFLFFLSCLVLFALPSLPLLPLLSHDVSHSPCLSIKILMNKNLWISNCDI